MRPANSLFRSLSLAPLLVLSLAACGKDGTGPAPLTPEEVGATYTVCSLVFTPEGAQPAVDVRARGINTSPNARLRASLRMRTDQRTFTVEYTKIPSDEIGQLGGSYELGSSTATLVFSGAANARGELLLPSRLDLDFQAAPRKQLTTPEGRSTYSVPRADYTRLAGIPEAGLAAEIPGRLTARFVEGSCD